MKKFAWIAILAICLLASMAMAHTTAGAQTLQAVHFQRGVDASGAEDNTTSITLPKGKWLVTGIVTAQNSGTADHVATCSFNPSGEAQVIATRTVAASRQQTITLNDTFVGPVSLSLSCKSDDYPATDVAFPGISLMIAPVVKKR